MVSTVLVQGQGRLVEVEPAAAVAGERRPAGEEKTFRPYDPGQVLLMAPVLSEWIPEGDLAHFVSDLVESGAFDLSAIYADYEEERGYPPYDPRLMVKLLVYGYANAIVSSRKLERATYRDVAVRMLCADQHPDYRSIARFRARHLAALGELFVQALRLCRQAKLVGLGTLAVDGAKLRANASRREAMSYERMGKAEAQLEAEIAVIRANVAALLSEAETVDAAEDARYGPDRRGDELPEELQRREQRLAAIREAEQALEAEAVERETARRAELAAEGKTPRRPPNGRDPFKPRPGAQRNFTDPESKIMKTSDGAYHQCYNGQAIVEPVFGQIDTVQDGRQLLVRGKKDARAQRRFHCAIHNLLKLHRAGGLDLTRKPNSAPASSPAAKRLPRAALARLTHSFATLFRRPLPDRFAWNAPIPVTDTGS
jgi:transposase